MQNMSFRALLDGEVVAPAEVDARQVVECPECSGKMYSRAGEEVARHFYHTDEQRAESCPTAGESNIHQRCKALALAALKRQWAVKQHDTESRSKSTSPTLRPLLAGEPPMFCSNLDRGTCSSRPGL